MARRLEGNVVVSDNEYDFREICKALGVNEDIAVNLAKQTIDNIVKRMKQENVQGKLSNYYDTYRQCGDKTLNAFLTHWKLEPIAHLIKLKSNIKIANGGKGFSQEYCTFVMLKSHYDYYKVNGKAPKVASNGRIAKYETGKRSLVEFQGGGNVKVPLNATWKRFKDGVHLSNKDNGTKYTMPEMVLVALEEYMKNRENVFGKKEVVIDESKLLLAETTNINIPIDSELVNELRAFIQRYNAVNTPKVSLRDIVPKAIRQFLDRMPLIYVNPQLYAEEKALEEQERQAKK